MVAPVPCAGVEHVLREGIDLRHLRHGPVERGVETGHLWQARERLGERTRAAHVVRLVRGLHDHERVQVSQHIGVDQHRGLKPCAAEHHPMSGRNHLHTRDVASSQVITKWSAARWSIARPLPNSCASSGLSTAFFATNCGSVCMSPTSP